MSSDESSTIDIGTEFSEPNSPACGMTNPWGDMDIDQVPIEIVDDLIFSGDEESTEGLQITKKSKPQPLLYNPLAAEDHRIAALKFSLVINGNNHPVRYSGIGSPCPCPPMIM